MLWNDIEENKNLKKIEGLENKVSKLEIEKKTKNVLLFLLKETKQSSLGLFKTVKEIMKNYLIILVNAGDIQNIFRIGNKFENREQN